MNWKYVKPLGSAELISEYEAENGFVFPESFKKCIMEHNGGRPEKSCFDTEVQKERALKSLLSFNKTDRETIWKITEWNKEVLADKYVPFAIDNFGNLICFERMTNSIMFIDMGDTSSEKAADSFDGFISALF